MALPAGLSTERGVATPTLPTQTKPGAAKAPVIPTRPPVVGTDPIATPYDADQPLAQKAWDDALAQLGETQAAVNKSYGVSDQGNELDPSSHPYGLFQQAQAQSAARSQALHTAVHSRGFYGGGIEGQAEDAGQLAAGQATTGLFAQLEQAGTNYATGKTQAEADYNTRILNDQLQGAQWIQQNQLFSPPAATRSDAQVKKLVSQASAAWVKKFGGLGKTNKAGLTFQQLLDRYGADLYDPAKQARFAGQLFGGSG